MTISIRPADPGEAEIVADIHLSAIAAELPYLRRVHTDAARALYRRHGFAVTAFGSGEANEEQEPYPTMNRPGLDAAGA